MNAFRALIVKDLRILLRKRGGFLSAFALGAIIMLMASLSGESTPVSLGQRGAAAFWMGLRPATFLDYIDPAVGRTLSEFKAKFAELPEKGDTPRLVKRGAPLELPPGRAGAVDGNQPGGAP